jgi:CMP-N-acetylneuraminic acid synthetase
MTKIIALLPMKGNSERVPNKNLKNFCGNPLYHYVLNSLLKSKHINQVIINTDSEAIKRDVINNFKDNVIIHDRPLEIQGDFISMNKVIEDDLLKSDADIYLQTHSTNPLLSTNSIDKAIDLMISPESNNQFDSIFSVTKIQTRLYNEKGEPFNHNPEQLIRTQDLPPLFEENSNFYIFTKESFKRNGDKRIGKNPKFFEIDKIEAIDIDEKQDFIIAEALYKLLR